MNPVVAFWLILSYQADLAQPAEVFKRITAGKVFQAVLVVLAALLLVRLSSTALETLARRVPRSRFFFNMLAPVVRFAVWVGALLLILLAVVAPSRETLWAVFAGVGVALGLGAQDLVKNTLGGLILLIDRPYQLGDRVKIGDVYGEIVYIGLLSTRIVTPDDTRVSIPNAAVLTGTAWNSNSGALDCQVVTELFLPPDSDPVETLEIASEAAYSSPFVLLKKPVVVLLQDRFQEQPFVQVKVKAYVYDHRFEPAFQSDITVRAKAEYLRRGMLAGWRRESLARV